MPGPNAKRSAANSRFRLSSSQSAYFLTQTKSATWRPPSMLPKQTKPLPNSKKSTSRSKTTKRKSEAQRSMQGSAQRAGTKPTPKNSQLASRNLLARLNHEFREFKLRSTGTPMPRMHRTLSEFIGRLLLILNSSKENWQCSPNPTSCQTPKKIKSSLMNLRAESRKARASLLTFQPASRDAKLFAKQLRSGLCWHKKGNLPTYLPSGLGQAVEEYSRKWPRVNSVPSPTP